MALPDDVPVLIDRLESAGDPDRAVEMAAYMRDQFDFLGIATPERRAIVKASISTNVAPTAEELITAVDQLVDGGYRETHYAAIDLLRRWQKVLTVDHLPWLGELVTTASWWDTVDPVAVHPIGTVVRSDRAATRALLDEWVESDDMWLNRTAIIHQLMHKDETDVRQLLTYCDRHSASTEFFLRKAIGWALRQYARTDPSAVRTYVDARRDVLSGLTICEATKHLTD